MADRLGPRGEHDNATVQDVGETEVSKLAPGTSVGRYTVLELLGRGGMGAVYKAYDPELDRSIALKVLSPQSSESESTLQAHGRVMREAQALAQLSHPNVVAVHDVGKFEGAVYIAMELVEGKTVRDWLQAGRPCRREVLEVFRQAGEGLLSAHQAGLVHRDFKPANVIVGLDGRVRVADFGLVRSLSAPPPLEMEPVVRADALRAREISLESGKYLSASLTLSGRFLGTPHYMSPEQYVGKAIDARTDQYSFCVCLFEALYGARPFEGRELQELMENVLAGRRTEPPAGALVPLWLKAILEKGLAREAADRYPSMRELLDALAADPEEATRRAREARRRSLQYAGVGAVLATGLVLTGMYLTRGKELCRGGEDLLVPVWNEGEKLKIRAAFVATGRSYAADTFERVRGHLDRWALEWVGMHRQACQATAIDGTQSEKTLDLRMGCLSRKLQSLQALVGVFGGKPDGQVVDRAVEASLGLGGLAYCADVEALEQAEKPPEKQEDRRTLAELRGRLEEVRQLDKLGKYAEAEALLRELSPRVLALGFPPLRAEFAYHTALNLERLGKFAEAEPVFVESIQTALHWKMNELAAMAGSETTFLVGYNLQRHAEGVVYALHAQGLASGRGDDVEASSLTGLALIHYNQGKYAEAEALNKKALAIREKALGPDHPYVAKSQNNLALSYRDQGRYLEAEEFNKRALAILEHSLGPDHPSVAASLNNLALVYADQEKASEAEELYKRALAIREKALGPDHTDVARSLSNLAVVLSSQGKYKEAEGLHKRALAIREKALGLDHPYVAYPLVGLADTYEKEHRFAEALQLLERARAIRSQAAVSPKERAEAAFPLARLLWASGKDRARARSIAEEALEFYQAAGPGTEKERRKVEQWLREQR